MNKIFMLMIPLLGILVSCGWVSTWTKNLTEIGVTQTGYQGLERTGAISSSTVEIRTAFMARGTEPFWVFEQTSTGAKLLRAGQSVVDEISYITTETHSGTTILISATPVSTGSALNVILTPGVCSDGMSDTVYNYVVNLNIQSETLKWCSQI